MTNRTNVPGPDDEETGQTTRDSPHYRVSKYSGLLDIRKSKFNFKFFLVLLLLFVGFGWISWVSPMLELYGRAEEIIYTDISLQTRITALLKQQPLDIQKESFQSKPQTDSVECSSLIDGAPGVEKDDKTQRFGREIMCCDRSHLRTDVCYMRGDLRTDSQSAPSVLLYSHDNKTTREEKIKPYTRKWESSVMSTIDEVTLKILSPTEENEQRNSCQVQHTVPAVVFSTGGYTGNVYHEFNDGLLPLYITSQHLQGEVVFVILEYHDWWMMKYQELLKQLSKYPVIDFSGDKRIHCFPEMIVGMKIHDELSVDPSLMKDGKTIKDFQSLFGKAYPDTPSLSGMVGSTNMVNESSTGPLHGLNSSSVSMNFSNVLAPPSALKPKLVIISRQKSREILNQKEIEKLAEKIGFEVQVLNPQPTTEISEMFRALNSCDVMLGVHGAAMTHFLLMRPGSVFIQIVPLGTDWAADTYYGEPAIKLGLKYVEYKIVPEESSLYERYERNDPVLTDPDSINSKGWSETKKVYLDGQNVRPTLKRLKRYLDGAYAYSLSRV